MSNKLVGMCLTLLKWSNRFLSLYHVLFDVELDTLIGYTNIQHWVEWPFPSICTSFALRGHVLPLHFSTFSPYYRQATNWPVLNATSPQRTYTSELATLIEQLIAITMMQGARVGFR